MSVRRCSMDLPTSCIELAQRVGARKLAKGGSFIFVPPPLIDAVPTHHARRMCLCCSGMQAHTQGTDHGPNPQSKDAVLDSRA